MAFYIRSSRLVLLFLCLLCSKSYSDTFFISDQNGKPIKGVVIELTGLQGEALVQNNKQTAVMDQVNKRFDPELLVIKVNDDVNFPNSDDIRHHVYSFSPAKPFELKLYSGQPNAPLSFEKAGVVVLGCNIHDSMVGYIYVAESKYAITTNDQGLATTGAPLNYQQIRVWHPNQKSGPLTVQHYLRDSLKSSGENGQDFVITLALQPPKPRDTFQNVFKHKP